MFRRLAFVLLLGLVLSIFSATPAMSEGDEDFSATHVPPSMAYAGQDLALSAEIRTRCHQDNGSWFQRSCSDVGLTVHYITPLGTSASVTAEGFSEDVQTLTVVIPGRDIQPESFSYHIEAWQTYCIWITCVKPKEDWGRIRFPSTGAYDLPVKSTIVGSVQLSSGHPAHGTHVLASAVPGPDDVTTPTTLRKIAEVWTDSLGHFAFYIPPDDDLVANAESNGGYLNVSLILTHPGTLTVHEVSKTIAKYVGSSFAETTTSAQYGVNSIVEQADSMELVDCVQGRNLMDESKSPTTVNEVHMRDDMTGSVSYGNRADHTIDFAVSENDGANWSVEGSIHVGNSVTADSTYTFSYAERYYHREYRIPIVYGKYRYWISCPLYWDEWDEIHAMRYSPPGHDNGPWVQGNDGAAASWYVPVDYLSHMAPGETFSKTTAKSKRYAAAVSVFGVTLGASASQAGYITYTWRAGSYYPHHFVWGETADQEYYFAADAESAIVHASSQWSDARDADDYSCGPVAPPRLPRVVNTAQDDAPATC